MSGGAERVSVSRDRLISIICPVTSLTCASSSPTTTASTRRASTSASEIARELSDDVWVVAPEHDQSGVSHSLSLNDPLRLREVGERHFAVKGTPTDCVIMGVAPRHQDRRPISCCPASTAAATPPRT